MRQGLPSLLPMIVKDIDIPLCLMGLKSLTIGLKNHLDLRMRQPIKILRMMGRKNNHLMNRREGKFIINYLD